MASITTQERNELIGLFVTMFNGAPGADYLSAMVSAREAGASLQTLANNMAARPEFQAVYPSFLTAEEFADRVVGNLLPPSTPAGAVSWSTDWVISKVNSGESFGSVLLQAAQALMATNNPNYDDAKDLMENRIEVASYFSVTHEQPSGSLESLQEVIAGVTADPASVDAAKEDIDNNLAGDTFILTTGADTFTGSTGNDQFRALSVDANGQDATTFSAFDALDGGAGTDTLNIYSDAGIAANAGFPSNATVKNIEIVNFNNVDVGFGPVDASRFQGATLLNQVSIASAVTKLAATTTAGFQELAGPLSVEAADDATSASVKLSNVSDTIDLDVAATAAGKLDTVNITGTVVDVPITGKLDPVDLAVTVGKDVETLTLNSAIAVNLTVNNGAGKTVSTVDASGSAGAITYDADTTVANVTTGDANDTVTLNTVFDTGFTSASLDTGAGNDKLFVKVDDANDVDATVTVDAGDGNDSIEIETVAVPATATLSLNVSGGAGDDTVTLKNGIPSVTSADAIDGGDGTDTLVADGKALVAEDYILLTEVLTGFEGIKFITAGATIDASRMANYKDIEFAGGASVADKVADDQKLTTSVDLTATANGYKAGPPATYAGTLDITAAAAAPGPLAITANADTLNLAIEAGTNDTAGTPGDLTDVTLAGDVKTANVTLAPATDNNGSPANAADDVYDLAVVNIDTAVATKAMTTLTLSGNGTANVNNGDGSKLVTIDASGLNSADIKGDAAAGLVYTTDSKLAESIKLGDGLDDLTLTNSTFKNMDTIEGLTLVDDAAAGVNLDAAKSDALDVGVTTFVKTTITAGSLNLALTAAATSTDGDNLVFAFGGNTYIYVDNGATPNILDDTDLVVKLVGTVDLDLLVDALG